MSALPSLPLPVDALPEAIRKFGDPAAPAPAKMMAARGLVPIKGENLVVLLFQLSADPDDQVSTAAAKTLADLPEGVVAPSCEADIHPTVLDELARKFSSDEGLIEKLVLNHATADATIAMIALSCSEKLTELVATNQQRLLAAPRIIEALYKNKNTRMSTADRLIELAARNEVELNGIPSYKDHVAAIKGQLIPEASDEPSPSDLAFQQAIQTDEEASSGEDPEEMLADDKVEEKLGNLSAQIREMNTGEKIRFAFMGNAAARAILVRNPNRVVAMAAISAPTMAENEAKQIAASREVIEDVLRYIAKKRDWIKKYEIKKALVFNPRTPIGISMNFLKHLRKNDVKALSRNRGVPGALRQMARRSSQQI